MNFFHDKKHVYNVEITTESSHYSRNICICIIISADYWLSECVQTRIHRDVIVMLPVMDIVCACTRSCKSGVTSNIVIATTEHLLELHDSLSYNWKGNDSHVKTETYIEDRYSVQNALC